MNSLAPSAEIPTATLHCDNAKMAQEYLHKVEGAETLDPTLFAQVATRLFPAALDLSQCHDLKQNYCPPLRELYRIHASLVYNAGPYYSLEEVPQLLELTAKAIFNSAVLATIAAELGRPRSLEESGSAYSEPTRHAFAMNRQVEPLIRDVCSLSAGTPLAFVKSPQGQWSYLDKPSQLGESVSVLELIRQDNEDKCGEKKYRVRQTDYTAVTASETLRWESSSWAEAPSYWAEQLRSALLNGTTRFNEEHTGSAHIVCAAVGGVAKGTSTSGTDIDTTAYIVCSEANAQDCYSRALEIFDEELRGLPFKIQNGANIWPQVYCQDVQQWRRICDGQVTSESDTMTQSINEIHVDLGRNEPVALIFSGESLVLRRNLEPGTSTTVVCDLNGKVIRTQPYQPPRLADSFTWISAVI